MARRASIRGAARAAVLLLALVLAGCGGPDGPVTERFYAFGTLVEISLHGVDDATARRLAGELAPRLDAWHAAWHPWEGDGLARLNRHLARGEPATVAPELARLLRRAAALAEASGHRFNPAIGGLVRLWGFGAEPPPEHPPDAARIDALVAAAPRMSDLVIDGRRVRSTNPAVRVDLGAFAKGVAVGRLVTRLRAANVPAGIVNAGGDLQTFGRPGDRDWRIGIRRPDGGGAFATVTAKPGEAVFTSGDYERGFTDAGVRYHHILDPVTGRPARGVRSVTVIARDPVLADAAATALFVAPRGQWRALAAALGVERAMRIDRSGRAHVTAAMEERLSFASDTPPTIVRR